MNNLLNNSKSKISLSKILIRKIALIFFEKFQIAHIFTKLITKPFSLYLFNYFLKYLDKFFYFKYARMFTRPYIVMYLGCIFYVLYFKLCNKVI